MNVLIPANNINERKYIIHVLLHEFLGLNYSLEIDPNIENYIILLDNNNSLIIEDHFFGRNTKDLSYLRTSNVPEKLEFGENIHYPERNIPIIYGRDIIQKNIDKNCINIEVGIDIFASSFFMLTRWEEYVVESKEPLNRFKSNDSLAFKEDFLHRPVVNEYVEFLWSLLVQLKINQQRKEKKFTATITHDVDFILRWYSFFVIIKTLVSDILKRKSLKSLLYNIHSIIQTKILKKKDPYDTFDHLMSVSEKFNLKSHFFFLSVTSNKHQKYYNICHPFVKKLMNEITNRGHKIGIHPDIGSHINLNQWKNEYERLTTISPSSINTGRHHYLMFKAPTTWQIWDDMKMKWDSTICYHDRPGFRCGTCFEFPVFNFMTRKQLNLREKPLTLMDKSLVFWQSHLSKKEMLNYSMELINQIKKYNGEFVFLWHNNCFNVPEWKEHHDMYERIIELTSSNF